MQKKNKTIPDIEFWSDHSISRFILTVPALTLCLVVAILSIGINDIVGVVFNRFPVSTASSVQSFFAFLRSNIPIIRVALVIPLLLFVNPKFRELTPTEITIASLVAIGGGYFLDLLPVETANGLIPSAFLLLWCVAWGIIQYDYQQKYNKELEIREYWTKKRIQELNKQYEDLQAAEDSIANDLASLQHKYNLAIIKEKELSILFIPSFGQLISRIRNRNISNELLYVPSFFPAEIETQLEMVGKIYEESPTEIEEELLNEYRNSRTSSSYRYSEYRTSSLFSLEEKEFKEEVKRQLERIKTINSSSLSEIEYILQKQYQNLSFSHILDFLNEESLLPEKLRIKLRDKTQIQSFPVDKLMELWFKKMKNQEDIALNAKLRIFLNSSTFKIPFDIRKITLKSSRDTLRFLFVISLQASIFYVVNFWISSRIKDYYHYFLVGSLVVYLGVMVFHIIHRCLVETPVLSVIERMSDFAFNGLKWLDTPFEYAMTINNLIAEKVILFTERQYTLSLRSRNPLVLISLAVADISITTILLTIRILISSLRIVLNFLCFLFCQGRIILTTIVISLISIIVFIFYSIMPFCRLVWNVLLEISISLESNLRRRYLQWVLLIIWGLSINTLAELTAIRISGTYPWISSITFVTLIVSYLVFMFYGTLANHRTIEEEWKDIDEPLSKRLAWSVLFFVFISWVLIGIDRIFQINYFNPQPDLVVGTIILLALTIIVFIAALVSGSK
ncbi:MAG: hypothetical protein ACKPBV_26940 [Sphaerospermopsis kisseleviana]